MTERRGLGRGLSALLGEAVDAAAMDAAAVGAGTGKDTPIELIHRNPDQPRRIFTDAEIDELAASIREKGVLQPILVRPSPDREGEFQIVAGERRWRAAQKAGLRAVPTLVRAFSDLEMLEIGIVENVQRADLNALEEAQAYRALMERFGRTQDAVAQVVGKSRSHVANTIRLLSLPDSVQEHVMAGRLSPGHARALVATTDADVLAEQVVAKGLSVRQTEALARQAASGGSSRSGGGGGSGGGSGKSADTQALEQDLSDALGLGVKLEDRGGKGEITISYRSLEQLDDLCRKLMRG